MSEGCVWQKHYDEENNVYYYNTVDGSSQWDEPADFVEIQEGYDQAVTEEWHEHHDQGEYVQPEGHAYDEYNEGGYENTIQGTSTTSTTEYYDEHTQHSYEEPTTTTYDDTTSYDITPETYDPSAYDYSDHNTTTHDNDYYGDESTIHNDTTTEANSTYDTGNVTGDVHTQHNQWVEHHTDTHDTQEQSSYSHEHGHTESSYEEHHLGHEKDHEQVQEHDQQWHDYDSQQVTEDFTTTQESHSEVATTNNTTEPQEESVPEQGVVQQEPEQEENYHQEQLVHSQEEDTTPELIDPASLVPTYSEEDQSTIDAILDFEFDESGDFKVELENLGVLSPPCPSELAAIQEGMWCKASCKKLEILQFCLEETGTEEEWLQLVEMDGGRIIDYLLLYMPEKVHPQLQDGAGRCFAMMFMVCPTMWTFYGARKASQGIVDSTTPNVLQHESDSDSNSEAEEEVTQEGADFLYAIWAAAGRRVQFLCSLPADGPSVGPYLGFDVRDIEDFNLYDLDEYGEEQEKKVSPFDMRGAPDANTMESIWLLLLFQMCRSNMRQIGDAFRNRRVLQLGLEGEETGAVDPTDAFLATLSDLLLCSHKMKEDSSLILIKVIAAVNWQVPEKDLVGSTEIADLCAELQFQDISDGNVHHVNISDLLMHLLNDIGYPEHNQPEALPCLQLCYDLVMSAGYEGFFYQNDVRILVDMIIREITNLPATKAKEELIFEKEIENSDSDDDNDQGEKRYRSRQDTIDMNTGMAIYDGIDGPVELYASEVCPVDELTKQMYLKIAYALLGRSCWQELDDMYRKTELDELLNSLLDSNEINDEVTIEYMNRFLSLQLD